MAGTLDPSESELETEGESVGQAGIENPALSASHIVGNAVPGE
jgi:hypothetical protein